MRTFDEYLATGVIQTDDSARGIAGNYLAKARQNLMLMGVLRKIGESPRRFGLVEELVVDEWVVTAGYYAMYMAAMASLAAIGVRCKTHAATIQALQTLFIEERRLGDVLQERYAGKCFGLEDIQLLIIAKTRREIAQYSPTTKVLRDAADEAVVGAHTFVDVMEMLCRCAQRTSSAT